MRELAKEHPILFNSEMVRAILSGKKWQTRRVMKRGMSGDIAEFVLSADNILYMEHLGGGVTFRPRACPYGVAGNRLWVRETYAPRTLPEVKGNDVIYKANFDTKDGFGSGIINFNTGETTPLIWHPAIFMPRWASRIMLEIVSVRLQQLQDISEDDCCIETGSPLKWNGPGAEPYHRDMRKVFTILWDSINLKSGFGWDVNPWVWVIEFKKVTQ
jgi:hypothetical protein